MTSIIYSSVFYTWVNEMKLRNSAVLLKPQCHIIVGIVVARMGGDKRPTRGAAVVLR